MPKRKKYPKLPNGWGSVRYLGAKRRNPFAVHPPATERKPDGQYIRPQALCYVPSWLVGFAVLNAYRAGTYKPGDEIALEAALSASTDERGLDDYVKRIVADSNRHTRAGLEDDGPTFGEVFGLAYEWKTGEFAAKEVSDSTRKGLKLGFSKLEAIHDTPIKKIKVDDIQTILNECPNAKSTRAKIIGACSLTYKYAMQRKIIETDISKFIVIPSSAKEDEHGVPFSAELLERLWDNRDNPDCEIILILCYSGHRIGEIGKVAVDLERRAFVGGIKTEAGKDRVVPIHSAIFPLVEKRLARNGGESLLLEAYSTAHRRFQYGLDACWPGCPVHHTPHDTRHTFNMLAEHYGIGEVDRKRLLGHALPGVTNAVYGHRSLDDLRAELEKIQVPWL